jgi:NAD(P)-dependent dehydrogenase (short-subunit alcohol dehydrogenase family)
MQTVMITGASRGIGLEFVSQYNADGWRVFACCRTPGQADELAGIASQSAGRITLHQLDVDDGASVVVLKFELDDQPIDVLLNNAGIIGQRDSSRAVLTTRPGRTASSPMCSDPCAYPKFSPTMSPPQSRKN